MGLETFIGAVSVSVRVRVVCQVTPKRVLLVAQLCQPMPLPQWAQRL